MSLAEPTDIFADVQAESVIVGYVLWKKCGTNKAVMQKGGKTYVKEKLQYSKSGHSYTKHNR